MLNTRQWRVLSKSMNWHAWQQLSHSLPFVQPANSSMCFLFQFNLLAELGELACQSSPLFNFSCVFQSWPTQTLMHCVWELGSHYYKDVSSSHYHTAYTIHTMFIYYPYWNCDTFWNTKLIWLCFYADPSKSDAINRKLQILNLLYLMFCGFSV